MGQAKIRGSQAQRADAAQARERAKLPASVKCNSCQADLTAITPLDVRNLRGIQVAGAAECEPCGRTTWVLNGNPTDVQNAFAILEDMLGQGLMGSAVKADRSV